MSEQEEKVKIEKGMINAQFVPLVQKSRIEVMGRVYLFTEAGPSEHSLRIRREIEGDEQAYVRKVMVGENLQELDFGWFYGESGQEAGFITIANEEGAVKKVNPTPEEMADSLKKVIEVSFEGLPECSIQIFPGEVMPICTANPRKLRIRCSSGSVRCTLTVFPR